VAVVGLLIVAAGRVDWAAAGRVAKSADRAMLAIAVAVNLLSIVLRGVRWWIFLRRVAPVPLRIAIRGALVGSGFNNLLIANGGDAARALLVARATGMPRSPILASVALDRLFDPICFLLLLVGATFVLPLPPRLDQTRLVAGVVLVAAIVLLALLVRPRPESARKPDVTGIARQLREFVGHVRDVSSARTFVVAMLLSSGVWSLQIAVFALVAAAAHLTLPVAGSVGALLLTNTGLILRATPGNVGYFQAAYAIAAAPFDVSTDAAVAAAILLQLVQMVPTTLLALGLAPRLMKPVSRA